MTVMEWEPSSWRRMPVKQEVDYPDRKAADEALDRLRKLPPLVTADEIVRLRNELRDVAAGRSFLLQGGDCAELFSYCEGEAIDAKIKLLLQMSLVLIWGGGRRVVRIGRMAGQYAKPRSKPTEKHEGKEINSFRGDILNGYDVEDRELNPSRLVEAYYHSASTLNHIRAQLSSGFADLHNHSEWKLGHVKNPQVRDKYEAIVTSIQESLRFMKTVGAGSTEELSTVNLYTSHEGLVLDYEEALTRRLRHPNNRVVNASSAPQNGPDEHGWYNTSAHFVWIGDRTRQLDGGHIEFFRGLQNPIGIKIGPSMEASEIERLLNIVNPDREVGKVVLITRYGEDKIEKMLGQHIEAVKMSKHVVIWQCDPMHGNTVSTEDGYKTRHLSSIVNEVKAALRIHKAHGTILGGVHLELTHEAVTECIGGSEDLGEDDLSTNYRTYCDPRLNENQALELAFMLAAHFREEGQGGNTAYTEGQLETTIVEPKRASMGDVFLNKGPNAMEKAKTIDSGDVGRMSDSGEKSLATNGVGLPKDEDQGPSENATEKDDEVSPQGKHGAPTFMDDPQPTHTVATDGHEENAFSVADGDMPTKEGKGNEPLGKEKSGGNDAAPQPEQNGVSSDRTTTMNE